MSVDPRPVPGAGAGERGSAYLVGLVWPKSSSATVEEHLDELAALADTAGFREAGRAILPLRGASPATLMGKGQAADVGVLARGTGASIVIVDEDLSPAQVKNLEKTFELPVVDRAGLIIDIFAARARSREARTQVEIAQLEYLLPRLAGRWAHLSRQVGGGPGGTKGEGEKQIELDRRMIRHRIDHLRRELSRIHRARDVRRRARSATPQAAFVGYTNVGKSSLFNAIVSAGVFVEDRLFATLDPTVRKVELGKRGAFLLKDTVGFIRKLPHHLVESFKTTFDEAAEAELLILVVDASHPAGIEQMEIAEQVLAGTEAGELPRLLVFNKADRLDPEEQAFLATRWPAAHVVSARTGHGMHGLVLELADRLLGREATTTLSVPPERGDVLARAGRTATIERVDEGPGGMMEVTLRGAESALEALRRALEQPEEARG
jgi:GTP-binding protein HflX